MFGFYLEDIENTSIFASVIKRTGFENKFG